MNEKLHANRLLDFVAANPRDGGELFQAAVVEQLCNINEMLRRVLTLMIAKLPEGDDDDADEVE